MFGVGAGRILDELRNHGTDPRTRGQLMDERLRAIIALWIQEKPEFHGDFVDFDPVHSWPKPLQRPHPPIYVGGSSERTFARLAEYGSAWLPSAIPPAEPPALGVPDVRAFTEGDDGHAVVVGGGVAGDVQPEIVKRHDTLIAHGCPDHK